MGNPLANMGGGMSKFQGMRNPMEIMKQFQDFRRQFPQNANPNEILNSMINSGRVTQAQVEQATQMAKQMGLIK
jgi:hypothetical protein